MFIENNIKNSLHSRYLLLIMSKIEVNFFKKHKIFIKIMLILFLKLTIFLS